MVFGVSQTISVTRGASHVISGAIFRAAYDANQSAISASDFFHLLFG